MFLLLLLQVPTGLVGLHQGVVDVIAGGVGVSVGLLPLVQLLFDGTQGIVDLRGRGVRHIRRTLRIADLLTHICSWQRQKDGSKDEMNPRLIPSLPFSSF